MAKKKQPPINGQPADHLLPADNKAAFLIAYANNMCDVSKACKAIKISRPTFYNWLKADRQFATDVNIVKQEEKDWWESQLKILARGIPKVDANGRLTGWTVQPDTAAVIFGNKTINRDRGYNEKLDINVQQANESKFDIEGRLTKEERKLWYQLMDKARIPDDDIQDAEIIP